MTCRLAALAMVLLLAACGQRTELQPAAGGSLPPPRYGTSEPVGTQELLVLEPEAAPERAVELRGESDERVDDPFDLPPES